MKVSEITTEIVADYIKVPDNENLQMYIDTSIAFIKEYTNIKNIDEYEEFSIVVLVLCQDMYDNRTLYVDKTNLNKVIATTLDMHRKNLGV